MQAKEVIEKLKSDVKDANGMTLMDAHKRMGPCYDFWLPDTCRESFFTRRYKYEDLDRPGPLRAIYS